MNNYKMPELEVANKLVDDFLVKADTFIKKEKTKQCASCSGTGKITIEEINRDEEGVDTREREEVCLDCLE